MTEDVSVGSESTVEKIGESHIHWIKLLKAEIKLNYYIYILVNKL